MKYHSRPSRFFGPTHPMDGFCPNLRAAFDSMGIVLAVEEDDTDVIGVPVPLFLWSCSVDPTEAPSMPFSIHECPTA